MALPAAPGRSKTPHLPIHAIRNQFFCFLPLLLCLRLRHRHRHHLEQEPRLLSHENTPSCASQSVSSGTSHCNNAPSCTLCSVSLGLSAAHSMHKSSSSCPCPCSHFCSHRPSCHQHQHQHLHLHMYIYICIAVEELISSPVVRFRPVHPLHASRSMIARCCRIPVGKYLRGWASSAASSCGCRMPPHIGSGELSRCRSGRNNAGSGNLAGCSQSSCRRRA